MVDLANRAQVLELLEACEQQKDQLTTNEFEMFSQLKLKYREADDGSFDDKICLEVMLRNIGIRKSVNMNKNEATRIIEVEKE
ncbi:MAG: hypothetical protein V7749_13320 [Cocleimonas sp.]